MSRSRRRLVAGSTVAGVAVAAVTISGGVDATDSASTEVYLQAADTEGVSIDADPEAFPAAVVAAAKGFTSVYRATPAFRQQVNRSANDVRRSAGLGFPFSAPASSPEGQPEQLLDR